MATTSIELMDHLKIAKAHIHGYSMGGAILTQILATHQDRLITAIYGGSGPQETDPKWVAQVPKDAAAPAAERSERTARRELVAYPGYDRAALDAVRISVAARRSRIDLPKVKVPVLALVGSFDRPNARTHRIKREMKGAQITVLPDETHGSVAPEPGLHADAREVHRHLRDQRRIGFLHPTAENCRDEAILGRARICIAPPIE